MRVTCSKADPVGKGYEQRHQSFQLRALPPRHDRKRTATFRGALKGTEPKVLQPADKNDSLLELCGAWPLERPDHHYAETRL